MPKVSVITPCYNTPPDFFRQCVESIQNQTLKDLELIIIDDGSKSPDQGEAPCITLCNSYASGDSRIKFLRQDHKGVSEARNLGIQNASGDYIVFLDSDDWFDPETLESLYNYAEEQNSDITIFENYRNTATSEQAFRAFDENIAVFEKDSLVDLIKNAVQTNPAHCGIIIGVCCKFYRANFLKENGLLFQSGISLGEDRMFFLNALCKSPRTSYLARPFYHYRESDSSLSQAIRKDFGSILTGSETFLEALPLCEVYGISRNTYMSWVYTDFARVIWASLIQYYINPSSTDSFFVTRRNFLNFISLDVCKRALKYFDRNSFSKRDLLKLSLCQKKLFSLLYLFKVKMSIQRKILCRHK